MAQANVTLTKVVYMPRKMTRVSIGDLINARPVGFDLLYLG
jgi:hypothetical protein